MNEKVMLIDTEVNNNFVYDIGFMILEKEEKNNFYKAIERHQFIVEQIYYNRRLFTTDYYKKKQKEYTSLMKARKATVKKFGHITQIIAHNMKVNNITKVYAFNSNYDKSKMQYTCNDFKVLNPFSDIQWFDLLAISNNFIHLHKDYINFAIENNYINATGFIETTAETTYQFIIKDNTFKEKHTSLADCEIELEILNQCIMLGYQETETYKIKNIDSKQMQTLTIFHNETTHTFEYQVRKNSYKKNTITLT